MLKVLPLFYSYHLYKTNCDQLERLLLHERLRNSLARLTLEAGKAIGSLQVGLGLSSGEFGGKSSTFVTLQKIPGKALRHAVLLEYRFTVEQLDMGIRNTLLNTWNL